MVTIQEVDSKIDTHMEVCCVRYDAIQDQVRAVNARLKRLETMVVSDGSPMDGATVLANDPHYLDRDLQATAAQLEAQGQIELRGIGVGLDLSGFYQRSTVLDLGGQTTRQVLAQVVGVLGYQ